MDEVPTRGRGFTEPDRTHGLTAGGRPGRVAPASRRPRPSSGAGATSGARSYPFVGRSPRAGPLARARARARGHSGTFGAGGGRYAAAATLRREPAAERARRRDGFGSTI